MLRKSGLRRRGVMRGGPTSGDDSWTSPVRCPVAGRHALSLAAVHRGRVHGLGSRTDSECADCRARSSSFAYGHGNVPSTRLLQPATHLAPPYLGAESALLTDRMPEWSRGQINRSGVLPARYTAALGFWHPRGRDNRKTTMPAGLIPVAGSSLGRCVRRRARGRCVS